MKLDEVRTHILDALAATPGMLTEQIAEHLKARGHEIELATVKRRMTSLRKTIGLKYQVNGNGERGWYMPEDAPTESMNLNDAIMQVISDQTVPMTTAAIADLIVAEIKRPCTSQEVSARLTKLARAGKVHRAGLIEGTTNRFRWLIGSGEPVEADEPEPCPSEEFTQHNSEADNHLNERTLALVPQEHISAIREAAKRMHKFRYTARRFGLSRVSKTDACDWPIRKLLERERDDRREVRYCALALWLSWRLDQVT